MQLPDKSNKHMLFIKIKVYQPMDQSLKKISYNHWESKPELNNYSKMQNHLQQERHYWMVLKD